MASIAPVLVAVYNVFMLRYAMLYYADPARGIDLNHDEKPVCSDFS